MCYRYRKIILVNHCHGRRVLFCLVCFVQFYMICCVWISMMWLHREDHIWTLLERTTPYSYKISNNYCLSVLIINCLFGSCAQRRIPPSRNVPSNWCFSYNDFVHMLDMEHSRANGRRSCRRRRCVTTADRRRTEAQRFAGNLALGCRSGGCRSPGLVNEALRYQPHGVALRYHDVGQLAALGGHAHLGAHVVLIHRVDEPAEWRGWLISIDWSRTSIFVELTSVGTATVP